MLSTDNWCIKIQDRIYGPYTQEQMADFATEGRLSGKSVVAPAGGTAWREANAFGALASLFEHIEQPVQPSGNRSFGKSSQAGRDNIPEDGAAANFILIFDVVAGTAGRLESKIRALGDGFRLTDNVWVLQSTMSSVGMKNALAPLLMQREPIFVVDCSRGRTAWHNFVPEIHSRLTKAWVKAYA